VATGAQQIQNVLVGYEAGSKNILEGGHLPAGRREHIPLGKRAEFLGNAGGKEINDTQPVLIKSRVHESTVTTRASGKGGRGG